MAIFRRVALLSALLSALTACASYHDQLIAQGYPPAYADGFSDGCQTGKQAVNGIGYVHKDLRRFAAEKPYQQGWDAGYARCVQVAQNEEQQRYLEQVHENRDSAEQLHLRSKTR
ncbi:MAG: hypothetical protein PGN19_07835 [Pseudomonas oryzihabitans]